MSKILINRETLVNGAFTQINPNTKAILRCSPTFFFINIVLAESLKIEEGGFVEFNFDQSTKDFYIKKSSNKNGFKVYLNKTASGIRYRLQSSHLRKMFQEFYKFSVSEKAVFECEQSKKCKTEYRLKPNFRKVKKGQR